MSQRLTVLKHLRGEASQSPELRYLFGMCLVEARAVFDTVHELVWRHSEAPPVLAVEGPLLVLGTADVYLGRASLERMRQEVRAGAEVVLPHRLEAYDLTGQEPLFSLRGFERLERLCLDELPAPPLRSRHLPVARFSPGLIAGRRASLSAKALIEDGRLLEDLGPLRCSAAGVFHEFVDLYGETREDILELLPEGCEAVLEVGCGRGLTGRLLQERLGCRVTGVEINEVAAAEAARHLWRVHSGDVRDAELEDGYDAVVATELLEHLVEPEEFLARMSRLVRPGGRIVLSVPNVGHYSIVEDLVAGRWDYLPIGLLCYTHLRFFTRATLESWLDRVGFSSWRIVRQTTELPARIARLPGELGADLESLRTSGFYVVIQL
jgi:SAM-dependent methyltransferase